MRFMFFPSAEVGVTRYSCDFDGSTEYLANTTAQAIGIADDWSISIWLRPRTLNSTEVLFRLKLVNNDTIDWVSWTTPKIQIQTRNSIGGIIKKYDWNGAIAVNTWTHLLLTWNGTTGDVLKLYIDSVDTAASLKWNDNAGTMADSNRKVEIAASGGASHFDGHISHMAIWNAVLDQGDVDKIYADKLEMDMSTDSEGYDKSANLKHWWKPGETPSDIGKDYVDSGTIDIDVNAANITFEDDIVEVIP